MNQRHGNKEQSDSNQRGAGRGITGQRGGRVKSRNMYKGSMDKDNGGGGHRMCGVDGQGRGEQWGKNGDNCN